MKKIFNHFPVKVNKINTKFRKIKTSIPVPQSIPFLKKSIKRKADHARPNAYYLEKG